MNDTKPQPKSLICAPLTHTDLWLTGGTVLFKRFPFHGSLNYIKPQPKSVICAPPPKKNTHRFKVNPFAHLMAASLPLNIVGNQTNRGLLCQANIKLNASFMIQFSLCPEGTLVLRPHLGAFTGLQGLPTAGVANKGRAAATPGRRPYRSSS